MKKIMLFIAVAVALCAAVDAQKMEPLQKLRYAEQVIERFYVDTVNTDNMVEQAIVAMLKTLDPHSIYTNAQETRELTEPLQGNFSGIGIQFNMLTDTLYVIQTVAGGPSERVGILAGDRIIVANDTVISGVKMKNTDVMKILRGPKGTVVNVKVLRKGVPDLIEFRIVRDDIPIYSVDASYMAAPGIGYIRISRFAESTFEEACKAIAKLQKKGMKKLIVDLEDNGGGYLNAAYQLAGLLLKNKDLVVFTKGDKMEPAYLRAEGNGPLSDCKVVVMVNQYSASASEILSGALQDNDRGLVVGRRTFGKGLVQRPFPFPDGSMIRLTVSRYYTPSGRSIQKPYTDGDDDNYRADMLHRIQSGELTNADSIHFADSLRYYTLRNNRPVYGGGGIMPDRFVPVDTTYYSDYYRDLVAKGVLNKLCQNYVDENRKALKKSYKNEDAFVAGFTVSDAMMAELRELGEKDGVTFNVGQMAVSEPFLRVVIKALIGRDLFEQSTYYRIANQMNPVYGEALKLISDDAEYDRLLGY